MYLPHMALYCLAIIKSTEANQFQAQEIPEIARAAYCPLTKIKIQCKRLITAQGRCGLLPTNSGTICVEQSLIILF